MREKKSFEQAVLARAKTDKAYREGLLAAAIQEISVNNLAVARALLRHSVNASIGFETLATYMDKSPKSLMRMLSANGNPTLSNIARILAVLLEHTNSRITVTIEPD